MWISSDESDPSQPSVQFEKENQNDYCKCEEKEKSSIGVELLKGMHT